MGSIQQLLNPINTPPQQIAMPPGKRKRTARDIQAEEAENQHGLINRKDENRVPDDMDKVRASGYKQGDIEAGEREKGVLSEIQVVPSTSLPRPNPEPAYVASEGIGKSASVSPTVTRRVSSSSLADILNPTDDSPFPLSNKSPILNEPKSVVTRSPLATAALILESITEQPVVESPTFAEVPPATTTDNQKSAPMNEDAGIEDAETEDEMEVDVTGPIETKQPLQLAQDTGPPEAPIKSPQRIRDIHRADSVDSEATIDDPVIPTPTTTAIQPPILLSSSSQKRKLTSESSPDEPISHTVPEEPTPSIPEGSQLQSQISVEKPQPPVRVVKKPKKQPGPKKTAVPKKTPLSALKKVTKPKRAENSQSVGFDDDPSSTRQSSVTPSVASTSSYDSSTRGSKPVYCICRKPDRGTWMIGCEICEDWFHGTCVHVDESDEPLIDKYACPNCEAQGKGKTVWLRKCRLPGCKKPAIAIVRGSKGVKGTRGSKYCCDEHGLLFFKNRLNNLDPEIMTKEQLRSLVSAMKGVDEFKVLGDTEPTISDSVLARFKTPEDDSKLADLRLEREKLARKLELVELRRTFLHLAVEKAKQLNADLKNAIPQQLTVGKNKPKAKEICGFDDRLSFDDAEFLEWSVSPEGKRIFAELRIDDDRHCDTEKRRCRHAGWQGLRGEDILMEESLLRSQLDGITKQEKIINEKQKVRARDATPSNGQVIKVS